MTRIGLVAVLLLLGTGFAGAQGNDQCDNFAWSLSRERTLFADPGKMTIASGETVGEIPKSAFVLLLKPIDDVNFALPPEHKPKSEKAFGGVAVFTNPADAGLFQVTISDDAWIDVVQGGEYAKSIGSTGNRNCPGVRKSVQFQLINSPIGLQISGAPSDRVTAIIEPK